MKTSFRVTNPWLACGVLIMFFLFHNSPGQSLAAEFTPIKMPQSIKGWFNLEKDSDFVIEYEAEQEFLFLPAHEQELEVIQISFVTTVTFPTLNELIKKSVENQLRPHSQQCTSVTPASTHSVGDAISSVENGLLEIKVGILSEQWLCVFNLPTGYSRGAKLGKAWSTLVVTLTPLISGDHQTISIKPSSKIEGGRVDYSPLSKILLASTGIISGVALDQLIQAKYHSALSDMSSQLPTSIVSSLSLGDAQSPPKIGPYKFKLTESPRFISTCDAAVSFLGVILSACTKKPGLRIISATNMPPGVGRDFHKDLPNLLKNIRYISDEILLPTKCQDLLRTIKDTPKDPLPPWARGMLTTVDPNDIALHDLSQKEGLNCRWVHLNEPVVDH